MPHPLERVFVELSQIAAMGLLLISVALVMDFALSECRRRDWDTNERKVNDPTLWESDSLT
jgi:hypothetical protein